MDFVGQKLAENISTVILWFGAILAFLLGYYFSNFSLMVKIFGLFLILALLVVVPDWPFYNRNPITWCTTLRGEEDLSKSKDSNNEPGDSKRNR